MCHCVFVKIESPKLFRTTLLLREGRGGEERIKRV